MSVGNLTAPSLPPKMSVLLLHAVAEPALKLTLINPCSRVQLRKECFFVEYRMKCASLDFTICEGEYNSKNTSKDEILKRIALAGYDSDSFLAPDAVYDNLHGCCKYDRIAKTPIKETSEKVMKLQENNAEIQNRTELSAIYDAYFTLKDALVNTDGAAASNASKELVKSIALVQMNKLENDVHMVWMQVFKNLEKDAALISKTTAPNKQREAFDTLSENMYQLAKVSKQEAPVYLQHCPMANDGKGANWLSREEAIKNPYYGSKMLTCGKVTATIK